MFFNQILNPRLTQPLVRLFGMKTGGNPAPTLAPEVQPGMDVNQLDDPTLYFLRKEKLMGCWGSLGGVALNTPKFRIRNPANSNVLVVVTDIHVRCDLVNVTLHQFAGTTDLTTVGTPAIGGSDTRWQLQGGTSVAGVAIVSSAVDSASIAQPAWGQIPINDTARHKVLCVINPGYNLTAWGNLSNAAFTNIWCSWYERPITNEELSTG